MILRFGINVMLIIGVWSFRGSRVNIRLGWGLTLAALALTLVTVAMGSEPAGHLLFLVYFLFCLLSLRLCFPRPLPTDDFVRYLWRRFARRFSSGLYLVLYYDCFHIEAIREGVTEAGPAIRKSRNSK
jgi:hypothetical protein